MSTIIPIKELRDTNAISERMATSNEPVFVTKNGYGVFVMMNMETYERSLALLDLYRKLYEAEQDFQKDRVSDPFETLAGLREDHDLQDHPIS